MLSRATLASAILVVASIASAQAGYKPKTASYTGVSPACRQGGANYSTLSCCLERGAARYGASTAGAEQWCNAHGFTR